MIVMMNYYYKIALSVIFIKIIKYPCNLHYIITTLMNYISKT